MLLIFCKKKKAKLIHISSTSVYGSQELYVDEECKELKPQSPYAEVKIKEEKILKKKYSFKICLFKIWNNCRTLSWHEISHCSK